MGTELRSTDKGTGSEILDRETYGTQGKERGLNLCVSPSPEESICSLFQRVRVAAGSQWTMAALRVNEKRSREDLDCFLGWFSRLQTEV